MNTTMSTTDLSTLRAQYLAAQLRGDRREALRVVIAEGFERGITASTLSQHVIGEAQREIGERWQKNEIGIADEHMATAISNLVLAQLYERAERAPSNGKMVLVSCVEGELHELPARLVADSLDNAGFHVRYLGASMPIPSLLQMIKSYGPDMIALSATMSFHASALRETVVRVREAHPNLFIAVGGGACVWDTNLAKETGANMTATNASELVSAARAALGVNQ